MARLQHNKPHSFINRHKFPTTSCHHLTSVQTSPLLPHDFLLSACSRRVSCYIDQGHKIPHRNLYGHQRNSTPNRTQDGIFGKIQGSYDAGGVESQHQVVLIAGRDYHSPVSRRRDITNSSYSARIRDYTH